MALLLAVGVGARDSEALVAAFIEVGVRFAVRAILGRFRGGARVVVIGPAFLQVALFVVAVVFFACRVFLDTTMIDLPCVVSVPQRLEARLVQSRRALSPFSHFLTSRSRFSFDRRCSQKMPSS